MVDHFFVDRNSRFASMLAALACLDSPGFDLGLSC